MPSASLSSPVQALRLSPRATVVTMKQPAVSIHEFQSLPYPVQRKYFSSVERLRIVEQSAHQQPQRHQSFRQPRHTAPNALQRSDTRARRRLRKRQSVLQEYSISQAEAQWFLSLPEKVRRRQFSREEQVLLAGQLETCILDPSDELLFPSEACEGFPVQTYEQRHCHQYSGEDQEITPPRGRSRRRSFAKDFEVFSSPVEVVPEDEDTLIYLDKMPPPPPSPQTKNQQSHTRQSSFRRTLSLSNFARHSTSSAPPISSPPLYAVSQQPWRPRAHSSSGSRHHSSPSVPAFDPEATHYQDPEARKKLRLFLASPQKFDEAIEFGFPSAADGPPRLELPKIGLDSCKFSHDLQTFLKDDQVSFLQDQDDEDGQAPETDDESMAELDSPITPSDLGVSFRHNATARLPSSNLSSIDSAGLPSQNVAYCRSKSQDLCSQAIMGNREMTLRMTLTRPDLRADEDALYGWQGPRDAKDDPFALEELHLSDDMTGEKGAFAVKPHRGLVSRFLNRVKSRR